MTVTIEIPEERLEEYLRIGQLIQKANRDEWKRFMNFVDGFLSGITDNRAHGLE